MTQACGWCGNPLPRHDDDPQLMDRRVRGKSFELHDYHFECHLRNQWEEWKRIIAEVNQ